MLLLFSMVQLKLSFGGGKSKKSRYFTFMGCTYSPKGLLTDLGPKNSEMRPIWARMKVWTLCSAAALPPIAPRCWRAYLAHISGCSDTDCSTRLCFPLSRSSGSGTAVWVLQRTAGRSSGTSYTRDTAGIRDGHRVAAQCSSPWRTHWTLWSL